MYHQNGEVDVRQLEVDRSSGSVGRGATASGVYRCMTPDGSVRLFKEFRPGAHADLNQVALTTHVRWRLTLSQGNRRRLDGLAAWPTATVRRDRSVIGVLMPEAPQEFFEQGGPRQVRDLTALARDLQYCDRYGAIHLPAPRKLAVLGHLFDGLAFLHGLGVVVGDLQPRNILTTGATGVPQVYFLDCDAYVLNGTSPFRMLRDPVTWKVPGGGGFSERTDLFKAALLVVRCLAENLALREFGADMFSDVLPRHEVDILLRLTEEDPVRVSELRAETLRPMAEAWQALVRSDGAMYAHNDTFAMVPWPPPDPRLVPPPVVPPAVPVEVADDSVPPPATGWAERFRKIYHRASREWS